MSAWSESLGGFWIALGAFTTWRDSRVIFLRRYWRGDLSMVGRLERRKALTQLRWSLAYVAIGLTWVTGWVGDPITAWLLGAYLVVLLAYDVSALRRSRKRRTSDCKTS
jgi:hypothetical protein